MLTCKCNNAISVFLFLACCFFFLAFLFLGDRCYDFTAQFRVAIMTFWVVVQQLWGIHTQNELGCVDIKSRRDVRPQGGVMSRTRTEVARLWWQAASSKELNIVGTVLGNRGTRLYRTGTCFTWAHCARVLVAVLLYGTACCGVLQLAVYCWNCLSQFTS